MKKTKKKQTLFLPRPFGPRCVRRVPSFRFGIFGFVAAHFAAAQLHLALRRQLERDGVRVEFLREQQVLQAGHLVTPQVQFRFHRRRRRRRRLGRALGRP